MHVRAMDCHRRTRTTSSTGHCTQVERWTPVVSSLAGVQHPFGRSRMRVGPAAWRGPDLLGRINGPLLLARPVTAGWAVRFLGKIHRGSAHPQLFRTLPNVTPQVNALEDDRGLQEITTRVAGRRHTPDTAAESGRSRFRRPARAPAATGRSGPPSPPTAAPGRRASPESRSTSGGPAETTRSRRSRAAWGRPCSRRRRR